MLNQKMLIVADMQNDFISGSLGTPEARAAVPRIVEKVKHFNGYTAFTKESHPAFYSMLQEGKNQPIPHCIKGTEGWMLCDEIVPFAEGHPLFEKPTFGSVALAEYLATTACKDFELVGMGTDTAVLANALLIKSFLPECTVSVDSACCAGSSPEKHQIALEAMKACHITVK